MNYWYLARRNEMFLDLDSRRALRRAITVLLVGLKTKRLPAGDVFLYKTKQPGHYHMIIRLKCSHPVWTLKMAWLLWMGNDRLRMAYVLARFLDERVPFTFGADRGDLLVATKPYYRKADAVCRCKLKHKEDAVTSKCPAMRKLLGDARCADYFARTGERRVKPLRVRVPWGEVQISKLKGWIKKDGKADRKNVLQNNGPKRNVQSSDGRLVRTNRKTRKR